MNPWLETATFPTCRSWIVKKLGARHPSSGDESAAFSSCGMTSLVLLGVFTHAKRNCTKQLALEEVLWGTTHLISPELAGRDVMCLLLCRLTNSMRYSIQVLCICVLRTFYIPFLLPPPSWNEGSILARRLCRASWSASSRSYSFSRPCMHLVFQFSGHDRSRTILSASAIQPYMTNFVCSAVLRITGCGNVLEQYSTIVCWSSHSSHDRREPYLGLRLQRIGVQLRPHLSPFSLLYLLLWIAGPILNISKTPSIMCS